MAIFGKNKGDKKTKKEELDDELIGDDSFDMEFDFEDFDFGADSKKRTVAENLKEGIKKGIKSKLKDPEFHKDLAKDVLPYSYSYVIDEATKVHDSLRDFYSETTRNVERLRPMLSAKLDKLLPKEGRTRDLFEKHLKTEPETTPTGEQKIDQTKEMLDAIFGRLDEQTKERETAERNKLLLDTDAKLKDRQLLNSMDENLRALRAYQDNINARYQRKSLEFQYHQLLATRELVKDFKTYVSLYTETSDRVIKNTGLPDFVKLTNYERLKETIRTRFSRDITEGIFGGNRTMSDIVKGMAERGGKVVREITEGFTSAMSHADMLETMGELGISKSELVGDIIGSEGAQGLGRMGAIKLNQFLQTKYPELYKQLEGRGEQLRNLMEFNAEGRINDLIERYVKIPEWQDAVKRVILGTSSNINPDTVFETRNVEDLYQPGTYTRKADMAITDVIPGYLARILREMTIMRTGEDASLLMFDYASGQFKSKRALSEAYAQSLNKALDINRKEVDEIGSFLVGGELRGKDKEALREALIKRGRLKTRQTPEAFVQSAEFKALPKRLQRRILNHINKMDETQKAQFERELGRILRIQGGGSPNVLVQDMLRSGGEEILREMGVVSLEDRALKMSNQDLINRISKGENFKPIEEDTGESIFKDRKLERTVKERIRTSIELDPSNIVEPITSTMLSLGDQNKALIKETFEDLKSHNQTVGYDPIIEQLKLVNEQLKGGIYIKNIDQVGKAAFDEGSVTTAREATLRAFFSLYAIPKEEIRDLLAKWQSGDISISQIRRYVRKKYKRVSKAGRDIELSASLEGMKEAIVEGAAKAAAAAKSSAESLYGFGKAAAGKAYGAGKKFYDENKERIQGAAATLLNNLLNFANQSFQIGKELLFDKVPNALKTFYEGLNKITTLAKDYYYATDVYVRGENEPRLTARLMRNGAYFSQKTGKVIKSVKDIDGPVVDVSGEVLLTSDDIRKGLVDINGNEIRTPFEKLLYGAGKIAATAKNAVASAVSSVGSFISGFVDYDYYSAQTSSRLDTLVGVTTQIRDILFTVYGTDAGKGPGVQENIEKIMKRDFKTAKEDPDVDPEKETRIDRGLLNRVKRGYKKAKSSLFSFFDKDTEERFDDIDERDDERHGSKNIKRKGSRYKAGAGLLGTAMTFMSGAMGTISTIFDWIKDFTIGGGMMMMLKKMMGLSGSAKDLGGSSLDGKDASKDKTKTKRRGGVKSRKGPTKFPKLKKMGKWTLGGIAAGMAADAVGLPEEVGNVITGLSIAQGVAGLFGTSLTAIASGLLSAGASAIAAGATVATSVLTAPVVLTGAAVAAAGYGGYKLYQSYKKSKKMSQLNDHEKFRLQQYGFILDSSTDHDTMLATLQLEEYLARNCRLSQGTGIVATFHVNDMDEILKSFDLDPDDPEEAQRFATWFKFRMIPVFASWIISGIDESIGAPAGSIEKRINTEKHAKRAYHYFDPGKVGSNVRVSTKEGIYVYNSEVSKGYYKYKKHPVRERGYLMTNKMILDTLLKNMRKKYPYENAEKDELWRKRREAYLEKEAERILKRPEPKTKAQDYVEDKVKKSTPAPKPSSTTDDQIAQGLAADKPTPTSKVTAMISRRTSNTPYITEAEEGNVAALTNRNVYRIATGPLREGTSAESLIVTKGNVDLSGLDPTLKKYLYGMIEEYADITGEKVKINSAYRSPEEQARLYRKDPRRAAPPGRSLHEYGLAVDLDSVTLNKMEKLGLLRKYGFTRPVGKETWHVEPIGIQANLAAAKDDPAKRAEMIMAGVKRGGLGYGTLPSAKKYKRDAEYTLKAFEAKDAVVDRSDIGEVNKVVPFSDRRGLTKELVDRAEEVVTQNRPKPPQPKTTPSLTKANYTPRTRKDESEATVMAMQNYNDQLNQNFEAALAYQKQMVEHLASIDANLAKVVETALNANPRSGGPTTARTDARRAPSSAINVRGASYPG